MSVLQSVIATLFVLFGLLWIHRNSERTESHLFLKLIGCYLLGSYSFKLQRVPIPVGFVVFLLFVRPMFNAA